MKFVGIQYSWNHYVTEHAGTGNKEHMEKQ
jgi:hypothetical protein